MGAEAVEAASVPADGRRVDVLVFLDEPWIG